MLEIGQVQNNHISFHIPQSVSRRDPGSESERYDDEQFSLSAMAQLDNNTSTVPLLEKLEVIKITSFSIVDSFNQGPMDRMFLSIQCSALQFQDRVS